MTLTDEFKNQCIAELSDGGNQSSVPEEKLEEIRRLNKEGQHFQAALKIEEFDEESPITYDELRELERGDDGMDGWDLGEFMRERADELRESETSDETGDMTPKDALDALDGKEGALAENLREQYREELQGDE